MPSGAIHHPVAILAQGRRKGRTVAGGDAGDFSILQVVGTDLVLWKCGIVVPSARSPGEVHLFAIWAYKRIDGLHVCWGIVELDSSSTIFVVHPKFGYPAALGHDDVVTVWGPESSWNITRLVFGHLNGVLFYHIDVPEVVVASTVGSK